MARDRPSSYGVGWRFYRSAGACPPRALECANDVNNGWRDTCLCTKDARRTPCEQQKMLEMELKVLQHQLLEMAGIAERMLHQAVESVLTRDEVSRACRYRN